MSSIYAAFIDICLFHALLSRKMMPIAMGVLPRSMRDARRVYMFVLFAHASAPLQEHTEGTQRYAMSSRANAFHLQPRHAGRARCASRPMMMRRDGYAPLPPLKLYDVFARASYGEYFLRVLALPGDDGYAAGRR